MSIMERLRNIVFARKRRAKIMRGKPIGITDDTDVSHEGIKTIDIETRCEFSGSPDLCVCIVTWNMNGQVSYEDIEKLVGRDRRFELLVIGLQEVPRGNICGMLKTALADTHVPLGKAVMQSLQLYVFGPKNSELFLRGLKADKQGVGGFGGLIRRKKGAVAIKIDYKSIRMLFISCHLSAHARKVDERNSQLRRISQSIFRKYLKPHANARHPQLTVWLGDLNYRLEGITTFPARDLIQENHHQLLTTKDQLLQEAERGEIFNGYFEGTLAFNPTYKYDIGSSIYDTSYKVRVPSWTDRILFKIDDRDEITASLHSYKSIDSIRSSDHKPVKAHLCLKLNTPILSNELQK